MNLEDWIVIKQGSGGYGLYANGITLPAIIGRSGFVVANQKLEGDGATPCGRWPLRKIYYRADRIECPPSLIATESLTPACGWCDDVQSDDYNCPVTLPFVFRHETMWRADSAYDLVGELGYNDSPIVNGRGSAIFLHCMAVGKTNTAGCIAVNRIDFMWLLTRAGADQHVYVPNNLLID